jgi:hypothetical protein
MSIQARQRAPVPLGSDVVDSSGWVAEAGDEKSLVTSGDNEAPLRLGAEWKARDRIFEAKDGGRPTVVAPSSDPLEPRRRAPQQKTNEDHKV